MNVEPADLPPYLLCESRLIWLERDVGFPNRVELVPQPLHELDIPVVMKVTPVHSFARDELLVATGIMVVGGVERLV